MTFGNDLNTKGDIVTHLTITPNATVANSSIGIAGDLTVTGNDISFGNGETISNSTDGTVLITSPTTSVSADLSVCEERDPKGLYKKARAGEIKGFTCIDAPYEAPLNPELIVETDKNDIEVCAKIVVDYLVEEGIISKTLV